MRRISFIILAMTFLAVGLSDVAATPNPNSAVIKTRIFNDCPTSIITTNDSYPALISIEDEVLDCAGFANLHNWRFSENDTDPVLFENASNFKFGAWLMITGTADGEAGLQISPWWSQDVDGRFNVRTTDGEIACFGGRLPFYSFTAVHEINYMKGTPIYLEMTYLSNDNTEDNPGTIEYIVNWLGTEYSSGVIPFDMGNPDEDPPYGLWGILNDAQAGGHFQPFLEAGNSDAGLYAEWRDIMFMNLDEPTAIETTTWGRIKADQ
jgi:hypothetical protein